MNGQKHVLAKSEIHREAVLNWVRGLIKTQTLQVIITFASRNKAFNWLLCTGEILYL